MEISEQIFQAVDILTDVKLSKLKYDKTIPGIIYEVVDLDKGIYRVKYDSSVMTAYARDINRTFEVGQYVYIKIPEGDFSNKKIITGLVTEQSLSEQQMNTLVRTVVSSSPDVSSFYPSGAFAAEPWKVIAGELVNFYDPIYGGPTVTFAQAYNNRLAQYAQQYDHLRIKANFKTVFNQVHVKGNYGIEVCFFTGDQEGEEITYKLDLGSFNGDPYRLTTYSPQEAIFAIEKGSLKGLKYVRLFEAGFEYDHEYLPNGQYGAEVHTPNIFAKDLEISFVEVRDLSNETYYCYVSAPFGQVLTPEISSVKLQVRLLAKGKPVNINKCTFKWFERDLKVFPGSENYNSFAGYGWRLLEDETSSEFTLTYNQIKNLHKREFKVVVSYENITMAAEKEILNGNSNYDYAIQQLTSGNLIQLQLVNREPNHASDVLVGDWYVTYPDGTYAEVTGNTPKNTIDVGDMLKYGAAIFHCAVHAYTSDDIVGIISYEMMKSESENDIIVTYSGQDTHNYDANGDLPADNYDAGYQLQVQVSWKEGKGAGDYSVEWRDPSGNKITNAISSPPKDSMLSNLWVDSEQKLHYNISNKFDYRANNNTVKVIIRFTDTGKEYSFPKEILFLKDGDQGTNGTSYVAIVRPCNSAGEKESGYRALKYKYQKNSSGAIQTDATGKKLGSWDNSSPYKLKCYVYKDGALLNGVTPYSPTFNWIGTGVGCDTPLAQETICRGLGDPVNATNSKSLERFVKVEVEVTDISKKVKLYVYYPIDVIVGDLIEKDINLTRLPTTVKYSAAGERPEFVNQASIEALYGTSRMEISSKTPTLVNPSPDKTKLEVADYYIAETNKGDSSIGILQCNMTGDTENFVLHPIILYLDTFGNAEINSWDGRYLEIGKDSKGNQTYVLAPQVGAGTKDRNTNTFTGVIMGKRFMEDPDSGEDYEFSGRTGLFGFHQGKESFGFMDNGIGFIGKAHGGRIWFNGNKAQIFSGNYCSSSKKDAFGNNLPTSTTPAGMLIDLDDGKIDAFDFKLSSGNMTLESSGNNNKGKFTFTLGSGNDSYFRIFSSLNKKLLNISNNSYVLQSENFGHYDSNDKLINDTPNQTQFETSGKGMKIDLANGKIWAKDVVLNGKMIIGAGSSGLGNISGQVSGSQIAAGAISETKIAAGAITVNKIADGAVSSTKIVGGAITAEKISANAITAEKISSSAITSDKIQAGAITSTKIAASAITSNKIQAGAIDATKISAGAITTDKLSAGAVTASKIAAATITANEIAGNTITAAEIKSGTITASEIAAGAITAAKIAAGAITADKLAANAIKLSGLMTVWNGDNAGGYLGYATGLTGDGFTTPGIAIKSTTNNHCIATTAGVRMTAGSSSIYVTSSGGWCNCNLNVGGNLKVGGSVTVGGQSLADYIKSFIPSK